MCKNCRSLWLIKVFHICKFSQRFVFSKMYCLFQGPVVIVSTEGGVNIEDTAATNPEAIAYFPIDIVSGITLDQAREIVGKLGLDESKTEAMAEVVCNLYHLFLEKDALLLEINPFVEDICGDCKIYRPLPRAEFFYRVSRYNLDCSKLPSTYN